MRARILLLLSILCASAFPAITVQAQQDPPSAPSPKPAQTQANDHVVEGTVVSQTSTTLVVRTDDNQYHLFTYPAGTVPKEAVKPGAHVRVNGSAPDNNGTEVAENVDVVQPGSDPSNSGTAAQAAPPPPSVTHASNEVKSEARRWHIGGKIGAGFSPEIFMFGVQSQIGPFFTPHLLFRPSAEFGFGELTDMFSINAEAAYRMTTRYGQWAPYFGVGPSFNFINQSASSGTTSFSNFNYKTGFNVFVGGQRNRTFVEMKTALWSGQAPVLRLFIGYNF
jgi:hypothetical protein